MRRKRKDAVLEGGVDCPGLVEFSVYDTSPVHFLSMEAEKLVRNNEKDIRYKTTKEKAKLQFYLTELVF